MRRRLTYGIFSDVKERSNWILLNHYITQFLTGHGDFAAKLEQYGLRWSAVCACDAEQNAGCSNENARDCGKNAQRVYNVIIKNARILWHLQVIQRSSGWDPTNKEKKMDIPVAVPEIREVREREIQGYNSDCSSRQYTSTDKVQQ